MGGSGLGMFDRFSLGRSVYPFNTPGAFVPHSAINLSRTKEEESPVSQSLDLTVSESGQGPPALVSVSSAGQEHRSYGVMKGLLGQGNRSFTL